MASKGEQWSSDKIYHGSRLHPDVQRRLEALQKSAEKNQFGYSKFEWGEGADHAQGNKKSTMTYKEALGDRNFDGAGELSARRPWVRFWTAIEPYDLELDSEVTKKAQEANIMSANQAVFKQTPKYQQIWEMGNEVWQSYTDGLQQPGASVTTLKDGGGFSPGQWLSDNPFSRPQPMINSVKTSTIGTKEGGLIRESVVDFSVFNMRDYENVVLPYFLRPGAEVFIDYGWDTAGAYPREEHLANKDLLESIFKYKTGYVDRSKGDMNVVYGLVGDFNSAVRPDGGYNCQVTVISSNFALMDFSKTSGQQLAPLLEIEIMKTLTSFYQDHLGVEFSPSYDAIYNPWDFENFKLENDEATLFRKHALLNLKIRNNKKFMGSAAQDGMGATPWEPSDKEFEAGIHYQPFKASFDHRSENTDKIKAVKTDEHVGIYDWGAYEAYFSDVHHKWWVANPAENIYVTFKWLEHFVNKHIGFQSKEGENSNLAYDMSSQLCSWNEMLFHKQDMLRWLPTDWAKNMGSVAALNKFFRKGNLQTSHSDAKWFLPPDTYTQSEFPDKHYVIKKNDGVGIDGWTSLGNVWLRLGWVKSVFAANDDFRKAIRVLLDTINEESYGLIRLRFYSGGADTKAVLVDTNVPSYTAPLDEDDDNYDVCDEHGGLYCAQELLTGDPKLNLTAIDADEHANLFAFSVQSPNSIVYDSQVSTNLSNNRLKTDLLLRTLPNGIPTFQVDEGWSNSMIMKSLLKHVEEGNVASKTTTTERNWDYLPGFTEASSKQRMVDQYSIRMTSEPTKGMHLDPTQATDFAYESLQAIYANQTPNYDWRQSKWEETPVPNDGDTTGGNTYSGQLDCTWHTIKASETLGMVARTHQVNYLDIQKWNENIEVAPGTMGIADVNNVKVGWTICVSDPGVVGTHKSADDTVDTPVTGSAQDALNNDDDPDNQNQTGLPTPDPSYVNYQISDDTMFQTIETNDALEYFEKRLEEPVVWAQTIGDMQMPIELNMHIYGTSGIYCQNIMTIDYLPKAYREFTYFRILKVEDIVTSTGWKTGIGAVMQFKDAGARLLKDARGMNTNDWLQTRVRFGVKGFSRMGYTPEDVAFFLDDKNKHFMDNWFKYQPGIGGRSQVNTTKQHAAYGDDKECQIWADIRANTNYTPSQRNYYLKDNDWNQYRECFYNSDKDVWKVCENDIRYGSGPWDQAPSFCDYDSNVYTFVINDSGTADGKTQADCDLAWTIAGQLYDEQLNSCCDPEGHAENCNSFNSSRCSREWELLKVTERCLKNNK